MKKKMWLLSLMLPLSAAAAVPQFNVIDLGIVAKPGNALTWPLLQGQDWSLPSLNGGGLSGAIVYEVFKPTGTQVGIEVGTSWLSGPDDLPSMEAAVWVGNTVTALGFLSAEGGVHGGPFSTAIALNSVGDVVGQSSTAFDEQGGPGGPTFYQASHAFLWNGGVMRDLGTLAIPNPDPMISHGYTSDNYDSAAQGVNDSHEVVGWANAISSTDNSVLVRAFLYSNGAMYNLSFFLVGSPAIRLTNATAINCQGNISAVGYAVNSGATHAYLLVRVGPPRNCPT